MYSINRRAFTMIELIFVIVVIGILAGVAIPKLAATRDDAIISKARATLASVRSALSTERQKRILRGDFSDMNKSSIGYTSTEVFTNLLEYPVNACVGSKRDCWVVGGTESAPVYTFRAPGSTNVDFNVSNNKINCLNNCTNFNF